METGAGFTSYALSSDCHCCQGSVTVSRSCLICRPRKSKQCYTAQRQVAKWVTKALPAQVETWGKAGWCLMGFSSHGVTPAQHTAVLHPLQSSSTAALSLQTGFCRCGPLQLQGEGCSNPPKQGRSREGPDGENNPPHTFLRLLPH